MYNILNGWLLWAFLAAVFAALTAIFAKVGVADVNANLATFYRTLVVIVFLTVLLTALGQWQAPGSLGLRTITFLVLSGLATGLSWLCYFQALKLGDAGRVAPIDKLSVVLVVVFAVAFLGEQVSLMAWVGVALIAAGAILVALG